MGRSDLLDMYARAREWMYQANHDCLCYICYVTLWAAKNRLPSALVIYIVIMISYRFMFLTLW